MCRNMVLQNSEWKKKGLGYCRPASVVPYFLSEAEYNAENLTDDALLCRKHLQVAIKQYERQRARRDPADKDYPLLPEPTVKQYEKIKKKPRKSNVTPEFRHYESPILTSRTRPSYKRTITEIEQSSSDDGVLSPLCDTVLDEDDDDGNDNNDILNTSQSSAEGLEESNDDITDTQDTDTTEPEVNENQ